ncbi:MAG: (4Fe-4S)-binding protein [Chitinophagales bacterium]|nr:(4Fe-4S)-binding protein [Chitinophagales bacterium]
MKEISKKYTNGEVTVVWKPSLCIHSGICGKLPAVFNGAKKPWIDASGAPTDAIINQVKQCPSGALSFYMNSEQQGEVKVESETIMEISKNGPLLVYGNICIKDSEGKETRQNKVTALCRCGGSSNKPFCDGTHKKIEFKG